MVKYGIKCNTILPNGALMWKKVVHVIWPDQYNDIFIAQERGGNVTFKQLPLPPEIPTMPESGIETVDSGTVAKLMEQFNNQLKIELINIGQHS